MRAVHLLTVLIAGLPVAAQAAETIIYTYDAKGRLTKVAHAGTANAGVVATYAFDAADNRVTAVVTGTPFNGPAQQVVVVPLGGGFKAVPLPAPGQ